MQRRIFFIFILIAIILAQSCAPTKNTATRRFYHNLVSRYNIYFNGREALRQGQTQLYNNHKDDYTNILEIMRYGAEEDVPAITPMMDRAAEKGSKVVLKHSMNFGGVEYNNWVDDSFMMIGKARFFKRDYIGAIEMFDFVSKKYSKNIIRYDALLWLAKAYLYSGRLNKCEAVFGMIEPQIEKKETSKYVTRFFPVFKAQYYIKTGNLELAAEYLEKALKQKHTKKMRARLLFVAGQVNQRLGKNNKALKYYQACIQSNPTYIMAFHAKIFSAECYDVSGGNENILKELNKLLKDPKNKEYYDVIYYSLANIELKKNNIPKAIEYLQLSAKSSVVNDYQKGISYRKLAELHFDMKKYMESKMYYDSTLAFLPKKHDDYQDIETKAKTLTNLVESLVTIELEDSLQRLAAMSERERLAIIDKLIAEIIKAEEKEKELERQRQIAAMQQKDPNMQMTTAPGSAWYFYNSSAVNFGRNEFLRVWGNRKLEDLWRLKNKEVSVFDNVAQQTDNTDSISADSLAKLNNPKERAYYLKNIPDTPEKIAASNKRIEKALYRAGMLYKDEYKDLLPAADMFERLLIRFPETEYKLQSLYNLYLIYSSLKDVVKAEQYKNIILTEFPDSDFAKILKDPDYYKKILEQSDEVKAAYKVTWELYQNKQYAAVVKSADEAIKKYNDPVHLPKFEYLKAVSLYRTVGSDAMIEQLEHLITNYPNSEVKPLAESLLAYVTGKNIQNDNDNSDNLDGKKETQPLYKPSPDSYHLFVLIVDVKTSNLNNIKAALTDHNVKFHSQQSLNVSTLFLNDQRHLLTVSRFNNQEDAERYFNTFRSNSDLLNSIENNFPIYFVISTDNYPAFYKDKDEQAYLDFFRRYYLQK